MLDRRDHNILFTVCGIQLSSVLKSRYARCLRFMYSSGLQLFLPSCCSCQDMLGVVIFQHYKSDTIGTISVHQCSPPRDVAKLQLPSCKDCQGLETRTVWTTYPILFPTSSVWGEPGHPIHTRSSASSAKIDGFSQLCTYMYRQWSPISGSPVFPKLQLPLWPNSLWMQTRATHVEE